MDRCPICLNHDYGNHLNTKDYSISGESFSLVRCDNCQFIWTADAPSNVQIAKYYDSEDYVSHSDTSKGIINKFYHTGRNFMLGQKYKILRKYTAGRKILDIGCGTGYFLNYLDNREYQTTGIEISKNARSFARSKFGLDVHHPDWFLNDPTKEQFNIITLWHVLEHLYDLDKYLQRIYESLSANGKLFVAVPNHTSYDARKYGKYWAGYDVPRHLWHFSPDHMKSKMAKHKLEIEAMKMMPLDPFYNSLLSEKYRGNRFSLISAGFFGMIAFIKGLSNVERASSIIYILKKMQ